jgi:type I restriction enzyme S subunit
MIELGNLILKKGGSVDPLKFPNEKFEYYSIPAYDKNEAEIVIGKEIGSSKKIFLPNDVLLSRIVPHIRRCWVVGVNKGYRQIGSSEWITFRSENIVPSFLRFYLMSDDFNSKFLKTIKGVGGSLMRADPSQVAKFKIPLPPQPQQQKIANILDAADALIQNDKALIAKYDELTQALFLDMFGDYLNGLLYPLKDLVRFSQGQQFGIELQLLEPKEGYARFLRIVDYTQGEDLRFVPNNSKNYYVNKEDIVIVRYGASAGFVGTNKEGVLANNLFKVNYDKLMFNQAFLYFIFQNDRFKKFVNKEAFGAAMPALSFKVMERFEIPVPPLHLQKQFAERVKQIEEQKAIAQKSLEKSESLFNSLLQKAFKGELA